MLAPSKPPRTEKAFVQAAFAVFLVFATLSNTPALAQDTVEFWWDDIQWQATADEEMQVLGIIPNASSTARLAFTEIGLSGFEYEDHGWHNPDLGFFTRENASDTPPIGESTRELITRLAELEISDGLFWTTTFYSECSAFTPWPYVRAGLVAGTTQDEVLQLAEQEGVEFYAWLDADTVMLRSDERSVYDFLDLANGLRAALIVRWAEPAMTWTDCLCGCPSGEPPGGGPGIPPPGGAGSSVLDIPALGEGGMIALILMLSGFAFRFLRRGMG